MHSIVGFIIFIIICCNPNYITSTCFKYFNCADIGRIGYPFWGGERPEHCGHPGYHLECQNGDTTEIEIMSTRYRVLGISEETHIMRIARKDFMDGPCPSNYTSSTLDTTLFNYAPDTLNLSLFYDCPIGTVVVDFWRIFKCSFWSLTINYYDTSFAMWPPGCRWRVTAAIPRTAGVRLFTGQSTVDDVLRSGFEVEILVNASRAHCAECKGSGGRGGKKFMKFVIAFSVGASSLAAIIFIFSHRGRKFLSNKLMSLSKKKTLSVQRVELFLTNYGSQSPIRYKFSEIKKITKSFRDKLGQGGYGTVFKGRLPDGREVAVKLLNESAGSGEEFINEVACISRTSHVNIVTLLGFCVKDTKRALVYEFMPNGSLEKFIYDSKQPHLGWKVLYEIALGIARGLEYLHRGCNTRILHFDIKPHNILLDQDLRPKISDFGLSKLCPAKESVVSLAGARGTPGFIAPEVISRKFGVVSHKSDVYSYGMMVLEMVGGRKNLDSMAAVASQIYFPEWIYNHLNQSMSFGLRGITMIEDEEIARKMVLTGLWCIQTNHRNRPSIGKVLEMLEGRLEELRVPPKPFFSSPARAYLGFVP